MQFLPKMLTKKKERSGRCSRPSGCEGDRFFWEWDWEHCCFCSFISNRKSIWTESSMHSSKTYREALDCSVVRQYFSEQFSLQTIFSDCLISKSRIAWLCAIKQLVLHIDESLFCLAFASDYICIHFRLFDKNTSHVSVLCKQTVSSVCFFSYWRTWLVFKVRWVN